MSLLDLEQTLAPAVEAVVVEPRRRHTTFTFRANAPVKQQSSFRSHAGSKRFAYNQGLALVKQALDEKARVRSESSGEEKTDENAGELKVPWSGWDLINAFNAWKLSEAAGVDEESGSVGLSWRTEICQQAFEEALQDLGAALKGFSASSLNAEFPRFKKKGRLRESFRIRQKSGQLRFGEAGAARTLYGLHRTLGPVRVREDTRKLRRVLRRGGRILSVTFVEQCGHWLLRVLVEAPALHESRRWSPEELAGLPWAGADQGFKDLLIVADAEGHELYRAPNPRFLRTGEAKLARLQRDLSGKEPGSNNRAAAKGRVNRYYTHLTAQSRHHLHQVVNELLDSQGKLVLEDLSVKGIQRSPNLGKSVQEAALGKLQQIISYKLDWRDGELLEAGRWYPSSKRCGECAQVLGSLDRETRVFVCESCGHRADRDVNAGRNLALWPTLRPEQQQLYVAGKRSETLTARGEGACLALDAPENPKPGLLGNGMPEKGVMGETSGFCP